jgi:hypothetical protein
MAWQDLPSLFLPGGSWELGWLPIVFAVSTALLTFFVFIYWIAKVFGWRNVEVRMVYEILQLVSNVVLAVFIVVLLEQLFTALIALVGGGSTIVCDAYGKITITDAGPIEAMRCSLMSKALKLTELYENMYVAARGPFAKFAKSFGILGFPLYYQGSWLWQSSPSHLYQEVENFRYLNDVLTHYLISINAYLGAVDFVQNTMLSLFLPIGIVLRSIPFSRGVGAFSSVWL